MAAYSRVQKEQRDFSDAVGTMSIHNTAQSWTLIGLKNSAAKASMIPCGGAHLYGHAHARERENDPDRSVQKESCVARRQSSQILSSQVCGVQYKFPFIFLYLLMYFSCRTCRLRAAGQDRSFKDIFLKSVRSAFPFSSLYRLYIGKVTHQKPIPITSARCTERDLFIKAEISMPWRRLTNDSQMICDGWSGGFLPITSSQIACDNFGKACTICDNFSFEGFWACFLRSAIQI